MPTAHAVRPCVAVVSSDEVRAALARHLEDILTPAELDQLSRFGSEKRRRDFMAGRLAAKKAVRLWLKERKERFSGLIEVSNDQDGVPYISGPTALRGRLHISIAHGELGGIAAAHAGPVGVDAELVSSKDPGVLKYYVREDELAVNAIAQTRLWTVKEAVLKMLGLGFAGGFFNVRWTGGASADLYGTADLKRSELGFDDFVVETWLEGDASYCLAYAEL
jgi:phosphopantetheinyl transferase